MLVVAVAAAAVAVAVAVAVAAAAVVVVVAVVSIPAPSQRRLVPALFLHSCLIVATIVVSAVAATAAATADLLQLLLAPMLHFCCAEYMACTSQAEREGCWASITMLSSWFCCVCSKLVSISAPLCPSFLPRMAWKLLVAAHLLCLSLSSAVKGFSLLNLIFLDVA